MRLVCLHADTVDALKRLRIQFDDLTPNGLWSSQYHLVGLTPDQMDALEAFQVQAEDVTPAQLAQAVGAVREDRRPPAQQPPRPAVATQPLAAGLEAGSRQSPQPAAAASDQTGREPARAAVGSESEVPLAQARDGGGGRGAEDRAETKSDVRGGVQAATPQTAGGSQPATPQKNAGAKGAAAPVTPPAPGGRKAQPTGPGPGSGQRYGTTRLRISVAGKYTEATVANGKIVVGGRAFDTPDQAAAELTKSRGDWTFWEYYDSADGKWRMLTRDWDTVLKSAAPGGR